MWQMCCFFLEGSLLHTTKINVRVRDGDFAEYCNTPCMRHASQFNMITDIPSFSVLAKGTGAGFPPVPSSCRLRTYILIIHSSAVIQAFSTCLQYLVTWSDGENNINWMILPKLISLKTATVCPTVKEAVKMSKNQIVSQPLRSPPTAILHSRDAW